MKKALEGIKVSKIAFFEWMAKGNGRVPENSN